MSADALKYSDEDLTVKKVGGEPRFTITETHKGECVEENQSTPYENTVVIKEENAKGFNIEALNDFLKSHGFKMPAEPEVASDGVEEEEEVPEPVVNNAVNGDL